MDTHPGSGDSPPENGTSGPLEPLDPKRHPSHITSTEITRNLARVKSRGTKCYKHRAFNSLAGALPKSQWERLLWHIDTGSEAP